MQYSRVINGIAVCATYSDVEINNIFIPLLKNLANIQVQKKKRILVMLAAPPGAGKSTLASFLEHISPDVSSGSYSSGCRHGRISQKAGVSVVPYSHG